MRDSLEPEEGLEFSDMPEVGDIPGDFKIENDRLIFEMEPIAKRMSEILKELPGEKPDRIEIQYDGFMVMVKNVES